MSSYSTAKAAGAEIRFLASVVGQAHGSQMDRGQRSDWRKAFGGSRGLDAPSWLWTSVLHLVATHKKAYLEHCRTFALPAAKE
jgi:uncharacterized protein (DUF2252 family)